MDSLTTLSDSRSYRPYTSPMRFLLLLCVLGCSLPGEEPSAFAPFEGPSQPPEQMILFAVLEGLYRDGVSTEAAASIAALDQESGIPLNFVYNCPLCMPALDAFRVYLERPDFLGKKQQYGRLAHIIFWKMPAFTVPLTKQLLIPGLLWALLLVHAALPGHAPTQLLQ